MRIVHHSALIEAASGMMVQVTDIVRAELRAGLDSGVVDFHTDNAMGGQVVHGVKMNNWNWAFERPDDTLHVIHSHVPHRFKDMKYTVIVLHGTPEHCALNEVYHQNKHAFNTSVNLINDCTAAITLLPRHKQFWDCYDHNGGMVFAAPPGVDCTERFVPFDELPPQEQTKMVRMNPNLEMPYHMFIFTARPTVMMAESYYEIKLPIAAMLSIKYAAEQCHGARLVIYGMPEWMKNQYMKMICKAYIDQYIDEWTDKVTQIERYYRGAHVCVSQVLNGDMSRTGQEAMACGTPAITTASKYSHNIDEWTCENNPGDIAEKIIQIWEQMAKDEPTMRKKARDIALERFNIDITIKALTKAYTEILNGK